MSRGELLLQIRKVNKEYQRDVINIDEKWFDNFLCSSPIDSLPAFYATKIRFVYSLKWAQLHGMDVSNVHLYKQLPSYTDNLYEGEYEYYEADDFFKVLKKFGWNIDYVFPPDAYENAVYLIQESDEGGELPLSDETVELLIKTMAEEIEDYVPDNEASEHIARMMYAENEEFNCTGLGLSYYLISHARCGKYFSYAERHPNLKKTVLYKQIYDCYMSISKLFYVEAYGENYSGFCESAAYSATSFGYRDGWEIELCEDYIDPVNLIRGYYLEVFLNIAEELYGLSERMDAA